jgi:transposase
MLAEIGDPTRFDSARALVKHAGLCPRENASGTFTGQSRGFPDGAGPGCGWPPGARSGVPYRTTP